MSEADLNSTALPLTVGQEATVQVAKPQPQGTVEIEISLPNPWVLRLQALASRFGRPESEVCFVLFLKGIRQGLTLVEYDAGCNFAVARQCDIDPRDGGESRS